MLSPIPVVATTSGGADDAPAGAVPIALYSDPVVAALIDAGFGTAGQVLAVNTAANGFVWVTPTT